VISAQRLLALDPRPDQRYWLLQELEALLEEAALQAPLLLLIDDVQWADSATLLALRTLVPRLAPVPILWVLAVRASAVGADVRNTLSRLFDAGAVRLVIGPLAAKAVSEVIFDRLDAEADPACCGWPGTVGETRSCWWSCWTGCAKRGWFASSTVAPNCSMSCSDPGSGGHAAAAG